MHAQQIITDSPDYTMDSQHNLMGLPAYFPED